MPSLRSASATAVAFAPTSSAPAPGQPVVERRSVDAPIAHIDRRTKPSRATTPVVFAIDQPRFPNKYVRLVDLALMLACLGIFVGVLAVGLLA